MYSYIARQPILNRQKKLVAYELLFRDGPANRFPNIDGDLATSRLLADNLVHQDIREVSGKHRCFINFTRESILKRVPTLLNKRLVVVEILEDIEPDEELLDAVKQLAAQGYHIALDDYCGDPRWHPFFPYVQIIKLDVRCMSWERISQLMQDYSNYSLKYVAEKVETQEEYQKAHALGIHYFQGMFFSKPEMLQRRKLDANQQIIFELLREATRKEPDLEHLVQLFSRDVTLSYKLMRYVNNLAFTKARDITSYKHALIYLGRDQLRRLIALLAAAQTQDKPRELHRMALVRARFCELLAQCRGKLEPEHSFMCGLFSVLDAMLDLPLDRVLSRIALDEEVLRALLHQKGEMAFYLGYIQDLEEAQWDRLDRRQDLLRLSETALLDCYQEALTWANLVFSIDDSHDVPEQATTPLATGHDPNR